MTRLGGSGPALAARLSLSEVPSPRLRERGQGVLHGLGVGEAVGGGLGQGLVDDRGEGVGDLGAVGLDRGGVVEEDPGDLLLGPAL